MKYCENIPKNRVGRKMGPVGKYRCFYRLPDEPKPPLPSFSHFQRLFFNFFDLSKRFTKQQKPITLKV